MPLIATEVEPALGMGRGYGAPLTELIIWQTLPTTASGMPPAVAIACGTTVMIPLSGAPAAPGLNTTAHPMVTGGPAMPVSRRTEPGDAREGDLRALDGRAGLALERR